MFPSSGLNRTFVQNIKPGDTPVVTYDGNYAIRSANLRPDGYLGYPELQQPFLYNGIDSLLLDFKMVPSPNAIGANGAAVFLMVQSSPNPNSRALESGQPGNPVDPFQSTVATMASNTLHDVQLEFATVESVAVSPWRSSPLPRPNYHAPSVAASVPAGSNVRFGIPRRAQRHRAQRDGLVPEHRHRGRAPFPTVARHVFWQRFDRGRALARRDRDFDQLIGEGTATTAFTETTETMGPSKGVGGHMVSVHSVVL